MTLKEHIKKILIIFLLVFGILSLIAFGKFLLLKSYLRNKYKIENASIHTWPYYGKRGDILSLHHKTLATSALRYNVYFDPLTEYLQKNPEYFEKNLVPLADSLSAYFKQATPNYYITIIQSARRKKHRYIPLLRDLTYIQYQRLKTLPFFNLKSVQGGMIIKKHQIRFQPFAPLASITIGVFKQLDSNNLTKGLENYYNSILAGKPGYAIYKRAAVGYSQYKIIAKAEDGASLLSTIDVNIQYFLETTLLQRLKELKASRGVGIIMDVKTGEIRAIANLNLDSSDRRYKENYNAAVQWLYAPGSVMKPLSMIALFEEYPNTPLSYHVNTGNGVYKIGDFELTDDKKGGYGTLTLEQVVAKSSNIGVAKTIILYFQEEEKKFITRLEEIGVSQKTGIDLKGERAAPLKHPNSKKNKWTKTVSLAQIAIGYEHKMTPLQIVALYNAIANDGVYITPHLVRSIIKNGKEQPNPEFTPHKRTIASKRTIAKVKKMLEGVVNYGTASKTVKTSLFPIAGKTGTAIIYDPVRRKFTNDYNTTFVGYFPADKPKYTMIIVISKPQTNKSGAKAAGPVFRKVAEQIYKYDPSLHNIVSDIVNYWPEKNIVPRIQSGYKPNIISMIQNFDIPYTDLSRGQRWVSVITQQKSEELLPFSFKSKDRPNVKTMSPQDAAFVLENLGFTVKLKGAGKVANQIFNEKQVKLILN